MADLNESTLRRAIQQEISPLRAEIAQLRSSLSHIEGRLNEIGRMHNDMQQIIADINKVTQQSRDTSTANSVMSHLSGVVEDLRSRIQSIERCSMASALYAEKRLKERTERGYA